MVRLIADRLVKVYARRRVVDQLCFDLKQGEIVGLLGPNGAGKTTTFYMIVGMIRPETGRILLENGEAVRTDITDMPMYQRARRGIGYLSQESSVFRRLTVDQNIKAVLETFIKDPKEIDDRCRHALQGMGITHIAHNKAFALSGGERRRVEICRALVTDPNFILLDEPFSGVDPIAVADIQKIVVGLKNRGLGVLITDHNVRDTLKIVDRAYIIAEGQILFSGFPHDLAENERVRQIYLGKEFTL